ncbi:hypothetical protein QCK34_004461 [Enterobacter asburiae]|nr:hypothetical protein [Enterobacter asburiae]
MTDSRLTRSQFCTLYKKLARRSQAWADLWYMLHLTGMMAVRLIHLCHEDVRGDSIHFPTRCRFSARVVPLTPPVRALIVRRRRDFPQDVWIFQSHSARVRSRPGPVTFIAFSQAIRHEGRGVVARTVDTRDAAELRPDNDATEPPESSDS